MASFVGFVILVVILYKICTYAFSKDSIDELKDKKKEPKLSKEVHIDPGVDIAESEKNKNASGIPS